ncbi:hypothetical protein CKA32_000526 [Geitlerinema sp. FC II]|nr:hypothetical protein CKA32_000483 [Geitlerinema sp. FC II]PPT10491.1 hypothetical protein CKA32_000526 [Geitlerinema sp. FC II]
MFIAAFVSRSATKPQWGQTWVLVDKDLCTFSPQLEQF